MDAALADYVAALEAHLGRRRGRERPLSPPDFELARGWFAAGVPLFSVLAGIDDAFARGPEPRTLQACRRAIERRAGREAAGATACPRAAADAGLLALSERLEALAADGLGAFGPLAASARQLLAAGPPATDAASPERTQLARDVARTARASLAAEEVDALQREAARSLARRARLVGDARVAALEGYLARRACERFGLLALL